jgi:biotin transport system substrate-specific component
MNIVLSSLFAILTGIGAFIAIPIGPVPITMQTLFTYLAGGILGSKWGALSQVIYVILGLIGIPFFAGGKAGIGVLVGPTGGYLIGFVVGAYVMGWLIEFRQSLSFMWILFSMVIGTLVIYTLGIIQLSLWLKIGLEKAILIGVLPFIVGDSLKILLATYITIKIRKLYKPMINS